MSIKVNPCTNIINFDGVDFSEHRSEEVMFLLRLSVIRDSKLAFSNMKVMTALVVHVCAFFR